MAPSPSIRPTTPLTPCVSPKRRSGKRSNPRVPFVRRIAERRDACWTCGRADGAVRRHAVEQVEPECPPWAVHGRLPRRLPPWADAAGDPQARPGEWRCRRAGPVSLVPRLLPAGPPEPDGGDARVHAELGVDAVDVVLDGLLAEEQALRDLAVGLTRGDEVHDLGLALADRKSVV